MTQKCLITLKDIPERNSNPRMRDADARKLYGTTRFSGRLAVTRKELFAEGVKTVKGLSISGVQQKLSMRFDDAKNTLVPTDTQGAFIIKPSPDQYPNCAEMEHLGMLISKALGINTAQCALIEFHDGEKAYVTRRFDRDHGVTDKRPMEDLCSLSDFTKDDKYESSYESAGLILKEATGGKLSVMLDYFTRILAAYLMGNEDLHLKNFSVIRESGDTGLFFPRLSPNYDCVPTIVYEISNLGYLAMPLMEAERQGKHSEAYSYFGYYTQQDFLKLGESLGLNRKSVLACIDNIRKKMADIRPLIDSADIPKAFKVHLLETVNRRENALQAHLMR
ncbi:type II toxin-antitoxin system HipA family toxin [Marinobacterium litorale]|uniref:type II toxin-antitoxin system HipA family toxin n=1 Tax=Marinobacterium litorale TaxID=404770 RepID=UPI00040BC214|nr:HipA domain-containing protein [Marinobacterium litorale]